MADRQFIGDEIHMMAADITILRQENELLKMTSERKIEENNILRAELTELKIKYEERVTEAVAIRTILENVVLNVSAGLNRYRSRRDLKQEHVEEPPIERRPPGHDAFTERDAAEERHPGNSTGRPAPAQAAQVLTRHIPVAHMSKPAMTEDTDPPPQFLRRTDSRIPNNDFRTDEDNLRDMHNVIGRKEG